MAKYKRMVVGSVLKSKTDGDPDYIKINTNLKSDLVLKPGQTLKLESGKFQLKSLQAAMSAGKISEEMGKEIEERIKKIPEWVRFEVILLEKKDNE